jgi:hypothetical protein
MAVEEGTSQDPDPSRGDFEREKWLAELELRNRELALKERDQANRDAELKLRQREHASSQWRSPLVVAILAAAVAATGNAVVAVVNGKMQRDVEERKSESGRILEMIKTGDTEKAAGNLEFLLKSGLVSDPALLARLNEFLRSRTPGMGPSLPASTSTRVGFERSDVLTESVQGTLQKLFDEYFRYLDRVGFPAPAEKVTVKLQAGIDNTYYMDDTIVMDPRMADDPSVPLREYNHHVLTGGQLGEWRAQYAAIESGLADYFACSFLNNPKLGERAVKVFDKSGAYIRNLANKRKFAEFRSMNPDTEVPYAGAEIWGGAFWAIREKLGREQADAIVAAAWLAGLPRGEAAIAPAFAKSLLDAAGKKGSAPLAVVKAVLLERGFPLPT